MSNEKREPQIGRGFRCRGCQGRFDFAADRDEHQATCILVKPGSNEKRAEEWLSEHDGFCVRTVEGEDVLSHLAQLIGSVAREAREAALEEAAKMMERTTTRAALVDGEVRLVLSQVRDPGASARARAEAIRALGGSHD